MKICKKKPKIIGDRARWYGRAIKSMGLNGIRASTKGSERREKSSSRRMALGI